MRPAIAMTILAVLVLSATPLQASGSNIDATHYYLSCPATGSGVETALLRSSLTGRTAGIIVYSGGLNATILWNDLPRSYRILAAYPEGPTQVIVVAHDTSNGTLLVFKTNTSSGSILRGALGVYTVEVKGGFIEEAFARAGNTTFSAATSTVFVEGNKTVRHLVILRGNLKSKTITAKGQPSETSPLSLEGSEPCAPALVSVTNESLDVAPLLTGKRSTTIYHVPLKGGEKPDPLSMIIYTRLTGALLVSHRAGETSRVLIIDMDTHESKARLYLSPPLPGIISFEPKSISRVNDTAYLVSAAGITQSGTSVTLVTVVNLGLNPKIIIYYLNNTLATPVGKDKVLLLNPGKSALVVSSSKIGKYASRSLVLQMNRTLLGLSIAPLRLNRDYNTSMTYSGVQLPASSSTTSTAPGVAETGHAPQRPSAPAPSPPESGRNKTKIIIAIIIIVAIIAGAGIAALRLLRSRSAGGEVIEEAVFRY